MKQLLVLLLFLCATSVFAQDKIVKKDGANIACRVVELKDSFVIYKKWTELNGDDYMMSRSEISAIHYADGKTVNLSEVNSMYTPGNQNDGTRLYNDDALLRIDYQYQKHNPYKKAKTLKTIGWIGAIPFVGMAIYCFLNGHDGTTEAGLGFLGGGAVWTSSFLLIGNHIQKKADSMLQSTLIIDKQFYFRNKTFLSTGIDMLSDHTASSNTIGLSLRYNF